MAEFEAKTILSNLPPSEELQILRDRIQQLEMESSSNAISEVFEQIGNDTTVTSWKMKALLIWNIIVTLAFVGFIGWMLMTSQKDNGSAKVNSSSLDLDNLAAKNDSKMAQMENDVDQLLVKQAELFSKIGELELTAKNYLKMAQMENDLSQTVHPKQQQRWDANKCDNELAISGTNNLTVQNKGNRIVWRSVFAEYSILNTFDVSFDIFYFEISVKYMEGWAFFGLAVKHQTPLEGQIHDRDGTYAYGGDGDLFIDGSAYKGYKKSGFEKFGVDDVVGFGVNLANKKLFFTKNGKRIGPTNLYISSYHSADQLFPFVSLFSFGDKIEANFGPNFMFNLATLS